MLVLYGWRTPEDVTQSGTTIADAAGVFDLIRESGTTESEWKAYRYVVKLTDGQTKMSGPFKDMDYGHYTDHIPPSELNPALLVKVPLNTAGTPVTVRLIVRPSAVVKSWSVAGMARAGPPSMLRVFGPVVKV